MSDIVPEILIFDPQPTRDRAGESSFKSVKIETLSSEMGEFYNKITTVFDNLEQSSAKWGIEEISISLEISADGKIGILGSSVSGGMKGGVVLKLKKI